MAESFNKAVKRSVGIVTANSSGVISTTTTTISGASALLVLLLETLFLTTISELEQRLHQLELVLLLCPKHQ